MRKYLILCIVFALLAVAIFQPGVQAASQGVVYYDYTRQSQGVNNQSNVIAYFQCRGFVLADSSELKQWMSDKIKSGAGGSTVIMSMGSVPVEIVESLSANCTLANYLKAGGKIVWLGGAPLAIITYPDGSFKEEKTGLTSILEVKQVQEGIGKQADITSEGTHWGITFADDDSEPVEKGSAGTMLTCVGSSSCSWVKNFNTAYPYSGFVKYRSSFDGKKKAWNDDAYRLALFEGSPITVTAAVQPDIVIGLDIPRHCFVRGEIAAVKILLQNQLSQFQKGTLVWRLLDGGNVLLEDSRSITIPSGGCKDELVQLQTSSLASKPYEFEVGLAQSNSATAYVQRTQLYIVRKSKDEFPFGVFEGIARNGSIETAKTLEEMSAHNITYVASHDVCSYPLMDSILKYGINLIPIGNFYFNSSLSDAHPEARMLLSNGKEVGIITKRELCFNHPLVQEQAVSRVRQQIDAVKDHPAFSKYFLFDDDTFLYDKAGLISCYCATCTEKFKKETGLEPPKSDDRQARYGASGVIPEDDPWLLWTKFRLYREYGSYHKMLEAEKNKIDPHIKMGPVHGLAQFPFFYPQGGLYPPSDLGPLSLLSSYFYPSLFRQLKDCIYHGDIAFMGNRNKELLVAAQAHDRKYIVPSKTGSILYGQGEGCNLTGTAAAPGWYIRNQYYNWLAGGAKGIIYFCYPPLVGDYGQEALEEIKNLGRITKMYGPLFKSLERAKKDIAVLLSITNNNCSYTGIEGDYHVLLETQLPVETICEEEVANGILSGYKVLVLEGINYLPKPVYTKIEDFIKQGGRVFVDKSSKLDVPGSMRIATWEELVEKASVCVKQNIGTSPQQDVVAREFNGGGITYLWLANTYTDRWVIGTQLYNTPVVPKAVTFDLKLSESAHVYDVLKGREIQSGKEGNTYNITLDEAGGTLLALYPDDIGDIHLICPQSIKRDDNVEIGVRVDCRGLGLQPVEIKVLDPNGHDSEYSCISTAARGILNLKWSFAINDAPGKWEIIVKELTTGKSVEKQLMVK